MVDDDAYDAKLACRSIGILYPHLCTRTVLSGKEAVSYLKGDNGFADRANFPYPVLVLLDLRMPEMDGFEVLAWLRNHPPHNFVPVVVLTGEDNKAQTAKRAYALGARSFLTKPLQDSDLENTIRGLNAWLNLKRDGPDDPSEPTVLSSLESLDSRKS